MEDFDIIQNRKNSDCAKWDEVEKYFRTDGLLPLWIADTDFKIPDTILNALKVRLNHPVLGYASPGEDLFDSFIEFYSKLVNLSLLPQNIAICGGVIPIVATSILTFTQEHDEIIFQTPGYALLKNTILLNNRQIIENPLMYNEVTGSYHIDFVALEKAITPKTKMWVFCNPHNPTTRVWKLEELREIERIATKHDILVVSDEIHGFMNFKDHQYIPLASISENMKNRSITATSPGKMFGTAGLIYSFAIIPNPQLMEQFNTGILALGLSFSKRSVFGLAGAKAAYDLQNIPWLNAQLDYIEKNYLWVKDRLSEQLPKIIVSPMESTFLMWINLNRFNLPADEIRSRMLNKAKIGAYEGRLFGDQNAGFYRINIGCHRSILEKMVDSLVATFKEY